MNLPTLLGQLGVHENSHYCLKIIMLSVLCLTTTLLMSNSAVVVVAAFGGSSHRLMSLPCNKFIRHNYYEEGGCESCCLLLTSTNSIRRTSLANKQKPTRERLKSTTLTIQMSAVPDERSADSSEEGEDANNSKPGRNNVSNSNSNNNKYKRSAKGNNYNNKKNRTSAWQTNNNKMTKQSRQSMGNSTAFNNNNNNSRNTNNNNNNNKGYYPSSAMIKEMKNRITQLERLVAAQTVELHKLRQDWNDLTEAATAFTQVVELLRQAGLTPPPKSSSSTTTPSTNKNNNSNVPLLAAETTKRTKTTKRQSNKNNNEEEQDTQYSSQRAAAHGAPEYEYYDDTEIFGKAPSSVMDAADAAGAAVLAAMLAGKLRMLVDVRDAELNTDPPTLVQFIELAILPVAAGLEGLAGGEEQEDDVEEEKTTARQQQQHHHRVKVVFPTVSKLLEYRKSMCLSAPDVVALSVLGFGSVEERDNLIVFIAPSPDNEEGLKSMMEIINPKNPVDKLRQPVVVLNHHMLPLPSYYNQNFEIVYHLRLLSVHYMATSTSAAAGSDTSSREYVERFLAAQRSGTILTSATEIDSVKNTTAVSEMEEDDSSVIIPSPSSETGLSFEEDEEQLEENDAALEAAMTHAYEAGVHQGLTRAMVIRAYPRPWHVFVDTSPDADVDFEVAATFDAEPTADEVNFAIIECLEGSEREDELVAQQMQEALESGQLNKVSQTLMHLGGGSGGEVDDDDDDDEYGDDDDEDDFTLFGAEST